MSEARKALRLVESGNFVWLDNGKVKFEDSVYELTLLELRAIIEFAESISSELTSPRENDFSELEKELVKLANEKRPRWTVIKCDGRSGIIYAYDTYPYIENEYWTNEDKSYDYLRRYPELIPYWRVWEIVKEK